MFLSCQSQLRWIKMHNWFQHSWEKLLVSFSSSRLFWSSLVRQFLQFIQTRCCQLPLSRLYREQGIWTPKRGEDHWSRDLQTCQPRIECKATLSRLAYLWTNHPKTSLDQHILSSGQYSLQTWNWSSCSPILKGIFNSIFFLRLVSIWTNSQCS